MLRFCHHQRGDHAHQHEAAHDEIGGIPGIVSRNDQGTAPGQDHSQPVAQLVGRRHGALQIIGHGLNAPGIDTDVLRGRREGDQQGSQYQQGQLCPRVVAGHQPQPNKHPDLGEQHPATALSQPVGQKRQSQAIDQRRPGELESVQDRHPGDVADGGAVNSFPAQPHGQSAKHQQQGEPCREPQKKHGQDTGLCVDAKGLAPLPGSFAY